MKKYGYRSKRGQSFVLIAVVMAALVLVVGLAVDAGNAYAYQRKAQSTANAAAIAGTKRLAMTRDIPGTYSDADIRAEINSITIQNGFRPEDIIAEYLDTDGTALGFVGSLGGLDSPPPETAVYIRVRVNAQVDTYFVRLAGFTHVQVNAATKAYNIPTGAATCTDGIYPIAVHNQGFERGNVYWIWDGDLEAPEFPGNFGWLRWPEGTKYANTEYLELALTPPGNIGHPEFGYNVGGDIILSEGDPMFGNPGLGASGDVGLKLDYFVSSREPMILPLWSSATGQGVNTSFINDGWGTFILEEYCFHHGDCPDTPGYIPTNAKAMKLTYLGPASAGCSVSVPVIPGAGGGEQGYGTAQGLVYLCSYEPIILPPADGAHLPVDLIHVVDTSSSMGSQLSGGSRSKVAIEKDALIHFNGLMRPDMGDRLGAVQFGGGGGGGGLPGNGTRVLSNLTYDIAALNSQISPLQANGWTPTGFALLLGTQTLFGAGRNPDNKPVLLLANDGAPTIDLDNTFNNVYENTESISPQVLRYCFLPSHCNNCCPSCTPNICPGHQRKTQDDHRINENVDAMEAADFIKGNITAAQTLWYERHGNSCTAGNNCPYYGVQAHPEMEIFVIALQGDAQWNPSVLQYIASAPVDEHYFVVRTEQDVEDVYTYIASAISGQLPFCYVDSQASLFNQSVTFQVIAGGAVVGEGTSYQDGSYSIPNIPVDPYTNYQITGTVSWGGTEYGAKTGCDFPGGIGLQVPLPEIYQIPIYMTPPQQPQCPEGTIVIPHP